MASDKFTSSKYVKIEESEFDISALVNEYDMTNETASSSSGSGLTIERPQNPAQRNLKLMRDQQEKRNFEIMLRDFNSLHVGHDYVRVPPRDPWDDLIFAEKGYGGFEEQIYFQPFRQEIPADFVPSACNDYSSTSYGYNSYAYSPLSSFGSYSSLSEQSTSKWEKELN